MANMLTNMDVTDMKTCYKMSRAEAIQAIAIEENVFGMETTAKAAKIGCGFRAIYCIPQYNLLR